MTGPADAGASTAGASAARAPRSAVIGLGGMGLRHVRALSALGWPIVGVVDRRPERFALAREIAPDVAGFDDVVAMLREAAPELVVIATNGPSHAPLSIAAMEAGVRYIACEKPMATSVADCEAMIAVAERTGARLSINHARRFAGSYRAVRDALAAGVIGKVMVVSGALGGGGWGVLGTHFFDLTRFLVGDDVVAAGGWPEAATPPNPRGAEFVDPGGSVVMELAGGARALWEVSHALRVLPRVTIHGELGTIELGEAASAWTVTRYRAPDGTPLSPPGAPAPAPEPVASHRPLDLVELSQRYLENLVSDDPIVVTGRDGMAAVEVVVALHESAAHAGARVALPLTEPARSRNVPIT